MIIPDITKTSSNYCLLLNEDDGPISGFLNALAAYRVVLNYIP